MADLGKVVVTDGGTYSATVTYEKLTFVHYNNDAYLTLKTVKGVTPTDDGVNYRLFCKSAATATTSKAGIVMPDGTTISISNGKITAKTATQTTVGVTKGSDDITVGKDGALSLNTNFKQATALANIVAGEALKVVLGKVSKAIATTMNLGENALLKNMISGIDVNDGNKVPSSAYIHTLAERIGMGTELVSGLGDLTAGLNTVNNNLSNSLQYVHTAKNPFDFNDVNTPAGFHRVNDSDSFKNPPLEIQNNANINHGNIFVCKSNENSDTLSMTFYPYDQNTIFIKTANFTSWKGKGWTQLVSKSDSLRFSRTYIDGNPYADAKNLSIPPGIYSVNPDFKNIPETTYGFLEIVADSINNWRLIKFIPTNIKSHYLMFYNGYDKTWTEWTHFTSVS